MPETWTLTPTAENQRTFDSLLSSIRESTCNVHPHERRGRMRGVFDIIVDGKTEENREDIRRKLGYLGLRCVSDEERHILDQGILLPRQTPSLPESCFPSPASDGPLSHGESQGPSSHGS